MRICLMLEGQEGVTWADWLAVADRCERLGFEGLFRSDHYFSGTGPGGRGSTDAWTLLAGLAARTTTLRLGTLVSPVTFREPALLAKAAITADEISGGRIEIGMGAGWWEEEHTGHGFAFRDVDDRWQRLEEQVEIVHGLLSQDRFSFSGKHYRLEDVEFLPKSTQRPHPPLILGGSTVGPRMRRLIGRFADEFNTVGGTPDEVASRFARARDGCAEQGRDPDALVTSFMTWIVVGRDQDAYLTRLDRVRSFDPDASDLDEYRAEFEVDGIAGTPERAVARLREYEAAGVQRAFLNVTLYDDLDMLDLLGSEVVPAVTDGMGS
jgi:F420-dependent oxidoreductase-like protein